MVMPALAGGVIGYLVGKNGQITVVPVSSSEHPSINIIDEIKRKGINNYSTVTVDLSTARTGQNSEQFQVVGSHISIRSVNGKASIILNEPTNAPIPISPGMKINTQFYRFFIINTAQPTASVILDIGRDFAFNIDYSSAAPGNSIIPTSIFSAAFGAMPIGTYYSTFVNLCSAKRAVLFIKNTLDVPVTVQAIGQIRDIALPGDEAYIATAINVIALTGVRSVGISDVYWHPYVAAEIIVAANPTVGALLVEASIQ